MLKIRKRVKSQSDMDDQVQGVWRIPLNALIASIGTILTLSIVLFYLGFEGYYGQDSHEYLRYARRIVDFYITGQHPGDYFWPVGYPFIGSIPGLLVGSKMGLVIVSALAYIGSVFFTKKILLLENKGSLDLYLILTLVFAPIFLKSAILSMSDSLCVFLILGAIYSARRYLERPENYKPYFSFVIFCALAFITRYIAALVLLPFVLVVLKVFVPRHPYKAVASLFVAALCLIPNFYIKGANLFSGLGHGYLEGWSFNNFFVLQYENMNGSIFLKRYNFFHALRPFIHPGFLSIGLVLIPFIKKEDFKSFRSVVLVSVLLYAFFLMGIPDQNDRFLLLTFPLIILLMYPGFLRLFDWISGRIPFYRIGMLLIIIAQLGLLAYIINPLYKLATLEKTIAGTVRELENDYDLLYVFEMDPALRTYDVKMDFENLWATALSSYQTGSLVLFNKARFERQWKGQNPMINWEFLQSNYQLEVLKEFPDGWSLYKIASAIEATNTRSATNEQL